MTFGQWLVSQRERADLKQKELAARAGISLSYVSALEREEPNARDGSPRRPRIEKVDKIAKALRVSIDEARLAAGYASSDPVSLLDIGNRSACDILKGVISLPQKDRDEITVAKSIFDEIVEFTEHEVTLKEKRAKKGGKARASNLTPEERSKIASLAATARWKKSD